MKVFVTTGPAWEPLDGMRRLTNASTGALGSLLSDRLVKAGHEVVLFRAEASTAPGPRLPVEVVSFGTNDDLVAALSAQADGRGVQDPAGAVLHAAALCDFRVTRVSDANGHMLARGKISSRQGRVVVELEPATKVLPQLRSWFPKAWIVGWKYEVEGFRDDALVAAGRQISEAGVDACVINGPAWGEGFGFLGRAGEVRTCGDREALAALLLGELSRR